MPGSDSADFGGKVRKASLSPRNRLSNMRQTHVNPPPSALTRGACGDYVSALMTTSENASAWPDHKPTALLVLADGTVLEGFGLGAEGHAVGEVCFNTAMTGYEEILTDPSYAGQLITFTFPHIGNVGTNDEDIETVNMAATPGARGVILRTAITDPSNYRATKHLDQWLKARGIIGLSGIDTRALTALIRSKGMPNAVIAHAQERRVRPARPEGRGARMAGPRRHGPGADGHLRPALHLGRDALGLGKGLWPADRAGIQRGRDRLRHQAQHPAAARRRRLQGHGGAGDDLGRRHSGDEAGRRVPEQRPRRSRPRPANMPCP